MDPTNLKIVLVNTWRSTHTHLGAAYIASYLTKYGGYNNIKIVEESLPFEEIAKLKPDIVGFHSYTPNYFKVLEAAKRVKKELKIPTVIGGPHISSLPQKLDTAFDVGVIGEAEETMLELMNTFVSNGELKKDALATISGICYHNNITDDAANNTVDKIVITTPRAPIREMDKIPFPARELLDMNYYLDPERDILSTQEKIRGTTLITSRGCPYRCIYCQSNKLFPLPRYHSAKYVVDEIKELYAKYGIEAVAIDDDLFVVNKKRLADIITMLKEAGLLGKIKFYCSARENLVNEELVKLLKELYVVQVNIGFETGSERLLKYLKNNSVSIEDHKRSVKLLNEAGIAIYGNFMIGNPTETKEEMLETLDFFRNYGIRIATLNITTPLPGTVIWDIAKERGLVNDDMDWSKFFDSLDHPEDQIYINEIVPHDKFLELFKQFRSEIIKKSMKNWESNATLLDMVKMFFRHPKNNLRVVLKNRKEVFNIIKRKLAGLHRADKIKNGKIKNEVNIN